MIGNDCEEVSVPIVDESQHGVAARIALSPFLPTAHSSTKPGFHPSPSLPHTR